MMFIPLSRGALWFLGECSYHSGEASMVIAMQMC